MRVALTGISGFVGSAIAEALHARGHAVVGLVRSSSRRDHVERFVERFVVGSQADPAARAELLDGADAVVHDAFDWEPLKSGDVAGHLQSNLLGALDLLHASAPRPFVFMSTIAVHHDMRPRWEGRIDEDHPSRPASLYGAAKAAIEAHGFAERYGKGRRFATLRPCAVYGIDPRLERSIGHPILAGIARGEPFTRPGGGKFVDVADVATVTVAALERDDAPPVVNLADCYLRWADWARIAAEVLGVAATIDDSSPAAPANVFSTAVGRSLGARLDRGAEGVGAHLARLAEAMGLLRSPA